MLDKCKGAPTYTITEEDLKKGNFQPFLSKSNEILDRDPIVKFCREGPGKKPTDLKNLKNLKKKATTCTYEYEGHRINTVTSLQLVDDQEKMSVNDFLNRNKMKQKGKEKEKEKDIELLKERELLTEKILMVLLSRPFFNEKRENHSFKYIIDHEAELISLKNEGIMWDLKEECGLPKGISGISSLWTQIGELFSMAPYHQEDLNLRSFNYMVYGEPKLWFGVHKDDIKKVEDLLRSHKEEGEACDSYFRHKSHWVHPKWLLDNNIQVYCCLQQPGEMMFTSGPHWILNLGSNINISMNFFIGKIDEVVPELSRFSAKHGSFCEAKCKSEKHSYVYPDLGLSGWNVKCTLCGRRHSWTDEGMRDHILFHCPKSPFDLQKNKWRKNQYTKEKRKSILKEYIKFIPKCEICKKSNKGVQRHWLVHHQDLHPEERCNICRKIFSRPSSLKNHIKNSKNCKKQ